MKPRPCVAAGLSGNLIGDTTMKNSAGNDVHFKMLKFPYKILEDVSRNFQIQQQPSSQENVIRLDAPPEYYRNQFLADAMVNLQMIDTIGSGIKRIFNLRRMNLNGKKSRFRSSAKANWLRETLFGWNIAGRLSLSISFLALPSSAR